MAKIIDADLLLQWVEKLEAYNMGRESCFKKPKGLTPEGIRQMIDTMPNVDAVPVVRCKDCKWAITGLVPVDPQRLVCSKGINWRSVEPTHFCSYGERKDNV